MTRALPALVCALACGCVTGEETVALQRAGALAAFVEQAEPVLETRCANPSCHGNDERPLSLFAPHRHRLDEADVFLDAPLTGDELRHNFLQAQVLIGDVRSAAHSPLLREPLAARAGGMSHAGVEVFVDTADYDYRRLHAWVAHALAQREEP